MEEVYDAWSTTLPTSIKKEILEDLIYPKLQRAIENWDLSVDTPLIHRWIFPWLRHLTRQLEGLYPTIRQKMSLYLKKWKENKDSKDMVLPWKDLWNEVQMASVTSKLVPQLTYAIQTLKVNLGGKFFGTHFGQVDPNAQSMREIEDLMYWRDIIGDNKVADILDQHFFPKWLHLLYVWLLTSNNFAEISRVSCSTTRHGLWIDGMQWYDGWRKVFEVLVQENKIRVNLYNGLNMILNTINNKNAV